MSNKISEHEECKAIEEIILDCKFKGIGSVGIKGEISGKLGLNFSRPTIDKHYKECMNGDILSSHIREQEKLLALSGGDSKEGLSIIPPFVDSEKLDAIKIKYKSKLGTKANVQEIREYAVLLCYSNLQAYVSGEERLKTEHVKYLRDIESVIKIMESSD